MKAEGSTVTRYHPVLAALHWLLAVLIIASLLYGYLVLAATPASDAQKIGMLRLHMIGGVTILGLMIVRLLVRVFTAHPAPTPESPPASHATARIAHYLFYLLVGLLAVSGLTTAVVSGINLIVFGGVQQPLPATLEIYPSRIIHGYLAAALAVLVIGHVLAACYHHFALKDRIFTRMAFGKR